MKTYISKIHFSLQHICGFLVKGCEGIKIVHIDLERSLVHCKMNSANLGFVQFKCQINQFHGTCPLQSTQEGKKERKTELKHISEPNNKCQKKIFELIFTHFNPSYKF